MNRGRCALLTLLMTTTVIGGCHLGIRGKAPNSTQTDVDQASSAPPPSSDGAAQAPSASEQQNPTPPVATMPICVPAPAPRKPQVAKRRSRPVPARPEVAEPAKPAETPPASNEEIAVHRVAAPVSSILGMRVRDADGADMGRVVDVLADGQGDVKLAVIEYGGFLGVGDRRIAVDWSLLRFTGKGDDAIRLATTRKRLQNVPDYKEPGSSLSLSAVGSAVPSGEKK